MEQNPEPTIKDVMEVVEFIRDNGATQDSVNRVETELKTELKQLDIKIDKVKNEMISHIDGFVGISNKQDSEIAAIAHRQNRLEKQVDKIASHLGIQLQTT